MSEERSSSMGYVMKGWEIVPACELSLEVTGNCTTGMLKKKTPKTQCQESGWVRIRRQEQRTEGQLGSPEAL